MSGSEHCSDYTEPVDTWWMGGDCPECGHVVYNNGTVRVCGEDDEQCDWWELDTDNDRTCDLCDEVARDRVRVVNEETGVEKDADLCGKHLDKLERHNDGENVEWEVEV